MSEGMEKKRELSAQERDKQAVEDFLAGSGAKIGAVILAALAIWFVVTLIWK